MSSNTSETECLGQIFVWPKFQFAADGLIPRALFIQGLMARKNRGRSSVRRINLGGAIEADLAAFERGAHARCISWNLLDLALAKLAAFRFGVFRA